VLAINYFSSSSHLHRKLQRSRLQQITDQAVACHQLLLNNTSRTDTYQKRCCYIQASLLQLLIAAQAAQQAETLCRLSFGPNKQIITMVHTRAFVYSLALCSLCSSWQPQRPLSPQSSLRNHQLLAASNPQSLHTVVQRIPRISVHDLKAEQLLQRCQTPLVLTGVFDHKQLDAEAWCDSLIERLNDRDVHYQMRRSSDGYTEVCATGQCILSCGTLLCTSIFTSI
jgi:hypothetical protein